ncbi:MAG: AAA family ATPase [Desulfococcaceae bacterium]
MIDKLVLREFKSFAQAEMTFGRFTALVGPNASGKSSVLDALHYLSQARSAPEKVFSGPREPIHLRRRASPDRAITEVAIEWGEPPFGVSFQFEPGEDGLVASFRSKYAERQYPSVEPEVARELGGGVFLHLDPYHLAKPAYSDDETPRVEYNGGGLAAVLSHLYLSEHDNFDRIINGLRSVVHSVRNVRIGREKVWHRPYLPDGQRSRDPVSIQGAALLFDMNSGNGIPAHSVSEGTLLTLGLLTVALGPEQRRPKLLLVDELERALHPRAVADLIRNMKEIIDHDDVEQIVVTTHSPFVLDCLEPEEVWLTSNDEHGASTLKQLIEHPSVERLSTSLRTGELWSVIGEDWTLTGAHDE